MTQLMVDTALDTVDSLHRVAKFIMDEADARFEKAEPPNDAQVPAGTSTALPAALIEAVKIMQGAQKAAAPLPPDEAPPEVDTAAIFGKKPAGLDGHGEAPPAPVSGATAPAAPTTAPSVGTATAPAGTVVLDSSGIPHDARIHQDTRKMNKNGTWQNKRGVDKDLLAVVTAELKAAWSKPADVAPVAPAAPAAPVTQVAPPPPAAPAIPAAAGQPASVLPGQAPGAIVGFRELMQKITVNTNGGKLSNDQVDAALASVGLPPRQLIALVNQPTLIPSVSAYIDACLAAG